jgi:hypothetical protein
MRTSQRRVWQVLTPCSLVICKSTDVSQERSATVLKSGRGSRGDCVSHATSGTALALWSECILMPRSWPPVDRHSCGCVWIPPDGSGVVGGGGGCARAEEPHTLVRSVSGTRYGRYGAGSGQRPAPPSHIDVATCEL